MAAWKHPPKKSETHNYGCYALIVAAAVVSAIFTLEATQKANFDVAYYCKLRGH